MLYFLTDPAQGSSMGATVIMLIVMVAIFYFLMIRPENKRKKAAQDMRDALKKGDNITTIGGLKGKVVAINDDTVVFETSEDRVRVEIAKWGVSTNDTAAAAAAAAICILYHQAGAAGIFPAHPLDLRK